MKNKFMTMMLIAMVAIVMSACGQSDEKTAKYETDLSTKEMVDQMVAKVEQPALMELQPEQVIDFYNLDTGKLEDFSIRIPMMNVKTNEIAIMKVKDTNDIAEVEAAVKERAEAVQKQFETYLPDQYENAKNYKVVTKGNYVLFVISEQADELVKVFDSFFEQK